MKAWRILPAFMALAILLSACTSGGSPQSAGAAAGKEEKIPNFNATGYPVCPDKKVTLRVMMNSRPEMPADLNSQELQQRAEKIMNIHVDWIQVPSTGWEEKKNLMLATGDLPDIIESQIPAADLTKYGPDGTFIPMQDLIDKYGVNFKKLYEEMPMIEAYITSPDGNIYGLCRVNSGPWMPTNGVGIINKAWLDQLGLSMPKTIDDFYEVLKAFKTRDPNGNGQADEIPMTFSKNSNSALYENNGLGYIISSFGIGIGGHPFMETYAGVRDGKVICQATLPEYKEAVVYLSKLYAEGLIDMEGFTMTTPDLQAKLNSTPATVGYTQVWDINDIVSNADNNAAYDYMPLLTGPNGRKPVFYRQPLPGTYRGWGVITKACKTPEVAMRWLDYHFDEDTSIEMIEGPIGVRVLKNADGTLYVRLPPAGLSVAEDRFANCRAQILAMPESVYRNRLKLPSTDKKVAFIDGFMDELSDPTPFQPVYYSTEEAGEMTQLQLDMQQYIDRRVSEWMMNGKVEAEWDAYLAEIEKVGLQKWLSIKQAAYDRFMAAS